MDKEIIQLLKTSKKPQWANNIVKVLDVSQRTVERAIKRLKDE